jgi:predicted nucleic acid-binding protein
MSATEELYLDTSALLPYYREEAVSDAVQALLMSLTRPALLTLLTQVELASALARWVRMGELTPAQAAEVESAYREDLESGCFRVVALDARHYRQAERWLLARMTPLRTLDALHLACAHALGAVLVTCDVLLARSASSLSVEHRLLAP